MIIRPSAKRTAIVYARVSTEEQGRIGASIEAQVHALSLEAERRGWIPQVVREVASGKSIKNRPKLLQALELLAAGEACALMAIRLDRISRSVTDFSQLMDRANRQGWALVMTEMDIDTTTSQGEFTANMMVSAAQFERRLIGDRTREGMAERARQGAHLGRSRSVPLEVVRRVVEAREAGTTLAGIAQELNAANTLTSNGRGVWTASKIQSVLKSRTAQQIQAGEKVTVPVQQRAPSSQANTA